MTTILSEQTIISTWQDTPGGPQGWLKEFGFIQYARAIESALLATLAQGVELQVVGETKAAETRWEVDPAPHVSLPRGVALVTLPTAQAAVAAEMVKLEHVTTERDSFERVYKESMQSLREAVAERNALYDKVQGLTALVEGRNASPSPAPAAEPVAIVDVSVPHLRSIVVKLTGEYVPPVGAFLYATPSPLPAAAGVEDRAGLVDELVEKFLADHFYGVYHCTRVWEGWNVGTMTQDDFEPAGESDMPRELAQEAVDFVLDRLASSVPLPADRAALVSSIKEAVEVYARACHGETDLGPSWATFTERLDRLASSAAQVPEDARDAARYRWLRREPADGSMPTDGNVWVVQYRHAPGTIPELRSAGCGHLLDKAVDAAMAAAPAAGGAHG